MLNRTIKRIATAMLTSIMVCTSISPVCAGTWNGIETPYPDSFNPSQVNDFINNEPMRDPQILNTLKNINWYTETRVVAEKYTNEYGQTGVHKVPKTALTSVKTDVPNLGTIDIIGEYDMYLYEYNQTLGYDVDAEYDENGQEVRVPWGIWKSDTDYNTLKENYVGKTYYVRFSGALTYFYDALEKAKENGLTFDFEKRWRDKDDDYFLPDEPDDSYHFDSTINDYIKVTIKDPEITDVKYGIELKGDTYKTGDGAREALEGEAKQIYDSIDTDELNAILAHSNRGVSGKPVPVMSYEFSLDDEGYYLEWYFKNNFENNNLKKSYMTPSEMR